MRLSRTHRPVEIPWTKEQLRETFKKFDKNGDDKLSRKELQEAFKYLESRWPYYRAGAALNKGDDNNDEFIDLSNQELDKLVEYANGLGYKVGS